MPNDTHIPVLILKSYRSLSELNAIFDKYFLTNIISSVFGNALEGFRLVVRTAPELEEGSSHVLRWVSHLVATGTFFLPPVTPLPG
jgi:hypothetical protein